MPAATFRRCVIAATSIIVLLAVASAGITAPSTLRPGPQKRVLVLYSTRRDTQFSETGDRLVPRLLAQQFANPPDYYGEYFDAARFPDHRFEQAFRDYLALKYRGAHFDVIIAMHALAYDFAAAHRDELFPGTPLVFLSEDEAPRRAANSAGIVMPRNFIATLRLALALQPDTTDVFVVTGHSQRDLAMEVRARAQFANAARTLRFTYSSTLRGRSMEQRLASLPAHTIVYYVLFYQDAAGVNVNPLQYLERIAALANRPTYSWVDSTIGRRTVGGGLSSIEQRITAVTTVAARVLRGERADAIPLLRDDSVIDQIDWRQLQRWQIPESRIPAGTRVLFQPPGVWERVRPYAIAAGVVMILEAALITFLLHQRAALSRAHGRIRDLGVRLVNAQEQERARLALELHDDVSQQLAFLSFDLQTLTGFGPTHDEDVETVALGALTRLERIAGSLHDLSHRLHPPTLRSAGLVGALTMLQRDSTRSDAAITFTHANVPPDLADAISITVFRVAQESLSNAITHSHAAHVAIHLEGDRDRLFLNIVDDGAGFDVEAASAQGLGLIGMRDRIDPIGGTVTVRSMPGRGTRVEVCVPTRDKGATHAAASADRRRPYDGAHGVRNTADIRM
jgi:signal transduction histidine kinase